MAMVKRNPTNEAPQNPRKLPPMREPVDDEDEEISAPNLASVVYTRAEIEQWEALDPIEKIALSDVIVKAEYGCTVVGNLIERVELENGPGKSAANPKGLWYCYRLELLRAVGPLDDPNTGEVIEAQPGEHVLIPETARLSALARFLGKAIALRPKGQKALKGRKSMWLYEGVLLSHERMPVPIQAG